MSPQEILSVLESMATDLDYRIQVGEVTDEQCQPKTSNQTRLICIRTQSSIEQRLQTIRAAMAKAPELAFYELDQVQEIAMGNNDRAGQSRAA